VSARTVAVFAGAFLALRALARGWLNPFGFHPAFYDNPVHPDALGSSMVFVALGMGALGIVAVHTCVLEGWGASGRGLTLVGPCRFLAERVLVRELTRLVRTRPHRA
jgi:hypothetical protein